MDYYELRDTNELDIPETINNPKSFSELSEIQKCFYDKTVLLTGGSGFIGSLLLESFLRYVNLC